MHDINCPDCYHEFCMAKFSIQILDVTFWHSMLAYVCHLLQFRIQFLDGFCHDLNFKIKFLVYYTLDKDEKQHSLQKARETLIQGPRIHIVTI